MASYVYTPNENAMIILQGLYRRCQDYLGSPSVDVPGRCSLWQCYRAEFIGHCCIANKYNFLSKLLWRILFLNCVNVAMSSIIDSMILIASFVVLRHRKTCGPRWCYGPFKRYGCIWFFLSGTFTQILQTSSSRIFHRTSNLKTNVFLKPNTKVNAASFFFNMLPFIGVHWTYQWNGFCWHKARYADIVAKFPNRDEEAEKVKKWANMHWKGPRPLQNLMKVDGAQKASAKEGYVVIDVRLGRVIFKVWWSCFEIWLIIVMYPLVTNLQRWP